MINFKYILLGAFLGLLAPMNAQNTKEEILDDDSLQTEVSDSAMVDSLQADSIPNLPWPESVKYRIDRLLESSNFAFAPWTLVNGEDRHLRAFALALRNLSCAGMKRNRGFGRIQCSMTDTAKEHEILSAALAGEVE